MYIRTVQNPMINRRFNIYIYISIMNIADNLQQVLNELPEGVRLVAVSKFHPNEAIEEAYVR